MASEFTLFECTRLVSWLRVDVCGDRYRKATTHGLTVGRDKFKALHGTHCTNCPVGREHAKKRVAAHVRLRIYRDGVLTLAEAPIVKTAASKPEGVTMVSPIKLRPRDCRRCGKAFEPRGSTDYYCGDECRAQKPATKPAGNQQAPKPRVVTRPAAAVTAPSMPLASKTSEALDLLALAGYQVRSVQTPAGVMLLVT